MDVVCKVCLEDIEKGNDLWLCEKCGKEYGPCCASDLDATCFECFEEVKEEE
jgi:hypothetical protein